jgi:cytoskeletal protein RodZ
MAADDSGTGGSPVARREKSAKSVGSKSKSKSKSDKKKKDSATVATTKSTKSKSSKASSPTVTKTTETSEVVAVKKVAVADPGEVIADMVINPEDPAERKVGSIYKDLNCLCNPTRAKPGEICGRLGKWCVTNANQIVSSIIGE